jgi:hypothetical protein
LPVSASGFETVYADPDVPVPNAQGLSLPPRSSGAWRLH